MQKTKLIEECIGIGKVYEGDAFLADVDYRIQVTQIIHVSGNEEIPGLKNIKGSMQLNEGKFGELINANTITLHLSDGRRWDCLIKSGSPVSPFELVNTSNKGLY